MPPEGAPDADVKRHRLAKLVDGLLDRKVVNGCGVHAVPVTERHGSGSRGVGGEILQLVLACGCPF